MFLGIAAVALQFRIMTGLLSATAGLSYAGAIVGFFSYFTITTNILVVLVHAAGLLAPGKPLSFFRRPVVRAGTVVSIAVVSFVYHFLLADLWNPQGLHRYTDLLLHYVCPAIMLVWWLGWGRDGRLRWSDILLFLTYPLAYLAYILVRAPIAGVVPYPFLDYWTNGWWAVTQSASGIAVLFIIVGVLVVLADRLPILVPPDRKPS